MQISELSDGLFELIKEMIQSNQETKKIRNEIIHNYGMSNSQANSAIKCVKDHLGIKTKKGQNAPRARYEEYDENDEILKKYGFSNDDDEVNPYERKHHRIG